MQIQSFSLKNIGQFQDLSVSLAPTQHYPSNITVFIGNNGSGKTSLLKSVTTALTWFVARLKHDKSNGTPIPESVILNTANSAAVEIIVNDQNLQQQKQAYTWRITKNRTARKVEFTTYLTELNQLTDYYKQWLGQDDQSSLPLIAFYPVERSVIDIPLKIREKHQFLQIDGYDNALNNAVDFRRFFEWFREREDIENEFIKDLILQIKQNLVDQDLLNKIDEYNSGKFKDVQLEAVRQAIYAFMPDFKNLQVSRKPRLAMIIDKNEKTLNVNQLSQGEKSLMALVGDIARRLAMMNPSLDNPLLGKGIILIDEIDMHLHPQWQRSIIQRLQTTFPNCQFILTTHSPLVISDTQDILVYDLDGQDITALPSLYGQDANTVLLQYMDTNYRNPRVAEQISQAMDAIQNNQFEQANQLIDTLKFELGSDQLEVMRLVAMLKKRTLAKQGK
ncbi:MULTISPECIES: AAA family ATPase [Acinetobacter calcoaceticus/baumannii complex]|uniref:AAA family ATPase n=1 Tax=Acinetobacter calcoaceticus/baumannii complex TaxID=909768 RepID=UPI00044A9F34|nr:MULTISPECIES: AAA family ATPase [Acinetobacter calcoaceticus/baumannii complex]EXR21367.1 recF/RecN/SMC N terminal domain protein [Acinetobacter baumannii 1295549]EXR93230.1 recF/RecN/SMC N terminal domain protein [Acinetobacter baumannii 277047]EXS39753.1 recF/RecN/SMC N terminal domain protein [Acinetobacter baumannii 426863]MDO7436231.1 AAA family ATPase [Acinetobacter nosocomialis]